MTTRNANLLLARTAAPAAGVQYDSIVNWYGGLLNISLVGTFDGASFDIVYTTHFPPGGKVPTVRTDWMADTDWISLGPVTGNGRVYGYINPCLLAIRVTSPGANTRVEAIVG